MKTKFIGKKWTLKNGLLYAGLDKQLQAILCGAGDSRIQIFDSRDCYDNKARFYGLLLNCTFEREPCAS